MKYTSCDITFTADNEDALVGKLQQHARQTHDMDMSDARAREAIKAGHT